MNLKKIIKSDEGAVLVVSMLLLVVLTVIGVAATNTSIMEILISNSHKKKQAAFYAAEAGLEHGKILLMNILDEKESFEDYDFLLDGTTSMPNGGNTLAAATDKTFAGGVPILENYAFDGGKYEYTVRVWNYENVDNDTDGTVYMRSVAEGTGGEYAAVEILLGAGIVDGGSRITEEKSAVDGGGTGKNYNASDENPVEAYTGEGAVNWQI